jgi:uncharacterized membrane protein
MIDQKLSITSLDKALALAVMSCLLLWLGRQFFFAGSWCTLTGYPPWGGTLEIPCFSFLPYNLALAIMPYGFARMFRSCRSFPLKLFLFAAWLAFLPNAPYIITDFVHFRDRPPVPMTYDLVLFSGFALTGLAFGMSSLQLIHQWWKEKTGKRVAALWVTICLFLCSYGIYIGRALRWNSWDLLLQPFKVFSESVSIWLFPTDHKEAILLILLGSVFLVAGYWAIEPVLKRVNLKSK